MLVRWMDGKGQKKRRRIKRERMAGRHQDSGQHAREILMYTRVSENERPSACMVSLESLLSVSTEVGLLFTIKIIDR